MTTDWDGRLLDLLLRRGEITATNHSVLRRFITTWQVSAYHALLMTSLQTEAGLVDALAEDLQLQRFRSFAGARLATAALPVVTYQLARRTECLPLLGPKDETIIVYADPSRRDLIDEVKRELDADFTVAVGELSALVQAIDELYPLAAQLPSLYGR